MPGGSGIPVASEADCKGPEGAGGSGVDDISSSSLDRAAEVSSDRRESSAATRRWMWSSRSEARVLSVWPSHESIAVSIKGVEVFYFWTCLKGVH